MARRAPPAGLAPLAAAARYSVRPLPEPLPTALRPLANRQAHTPARCVVPEPHSLISAGAGLPSPERYPKCPQ